MTDEIILDEIILKLIAALTPEDVRRLKVAGYANEVRTILGGLDRLALSCFIRAQGQLEGKVWPDVQVKVNDLWAVLREG